MSSVVAHKSQERENLTILVVDDVDFNLQILTTLITEGEARAVTAKSGEDALDKLAQTPQISVVLMDIGLPGIDGIEAARRIKQNSMTRHIPVIALTAETGSMDREAVLAAGMDGFLEKSFEPDPLWQEIDRVQRAQALSSPNAIPSPAPAEPGMFNYPHLVATFGDAATVRHIADAFFGEAQEQMRAIETAVLSGNRQALSARCHNLKGSATLFTADLLASKAAKLCQAATESNVADLQPQMQSLKETFARLRAHVTTALNQSH